MAKTQWLHGCTRVAVQPEVDKDGKIPEAATFDEPQIELIAAKKVKRGDSNTGGPMPAAATKPSAKR